MIFSYAANDCLSGSKINYIQTLLANIVSAQIVVELVLVQISDG